jgi:hypothetical protein
MVQQMIEGCFDPAPWGVQLHEGATWDEVRDLSPRMQKALAGGLAAGHRLLPVCLLVCRPAHSEQHGRTLPV